MSRNPDGGGNEMLRSRLVPYLLKSAAIVAVLLGLSKVLPSMPIAVVALALAILSLVPALGSVYRTVVIRTFNQRKFEEGSIHKGRFLLRIPIFIGFYVLSAISVASILLESPTWGIGMWATVVFAIPLYIGVSMAVGWFVEKKERVIPLVKEARAARISVIATGVLLCVVFTVVSLLQPMPNYSCAADAFMMAPKPFEGSPSALVREVGDIVALVGGLSSYALAKLSESSWHAYLVAQVALNVASMLGVAGMMSVCLIGRNELKRAFTQLEKEGNGKRGKHSRDGGNGERNGDSAGSRPVVRSFCIVFAVVPILVAAGLVFADAEVQDAERDEGYSLTKKFVRDQVSLIVYEFDGKYYNPDVVSGVLEHAREESEALSREAEDTLVSLVNKSFDARVANVDSYLDWYYGASSDWDRLKSLVEGSTEEYMKEQVVAHIEEGIDDSEINDAIAQYTSKCEALRANTLSELSRYELTTDYPSWLVEETKPLNEQLSISLKPTESFLHSGEKGGMGEAVGIIARPMLSVIAGLGVDLATKKVDELLNREAYKQELVSAIEEQREETLAEVRDAFDSADKRDE